MNTTVMYNCVLFGYRFGFVDKPSTQDVVDVLDRWITRHQEYAEELKSVSKLFSENELDRVEFFKDLKQKLLQGDIAIDIQEVSFYDNQEKAA